jgi:carbonic anhydrase
VGHLGRDEPFPLEDFADVLAANAEFAAAFHDADLTGRALRGLAIVTCIDSRIDTLGIVGMHAGDAYIVRNAGARVTDDVLRTLVLATTLMGVDRILVMPHTHCRMAQGDEPDIHATIAERYGIDTRSLEFRTVADQLEALRTDLTRIRTLPYLRRDVAVGGAIYDVESGRIEPVSA